MLGSVADADDVLQDAYLRWHGAQETIETPATRLTTTVTRLCLDRLKSARVRRETCVGPWVPEPMCTSDEEVDAESISIAFLLSLETLTPVERAAYLLHAVFDNDHAEGAHTSSARARRRQARRLIARRSIWRPIARGSPPRASATPSCSTPSSPPVRRKTPRR